MGCDSMRRLYEGIFKTIESLLAILLYLPLCIVIILGWGISGLINSETDLIKILKFIWECTEVESKKEN